MKFGKGKNLPLFPVINAFKVLPAANGPVHGIGANAELVLQFLHQLIRTARLSVKLVDKGKDRNVAHRTDLKQLSRLRLNSLGRVDDHDSRVRCHQCAVGILRKILVAGGIQNVDAVAFIFKLHNGRGDRNTSLLFQLHPVRNGMTGCCFPLDGACQLDRPTVEQKFFRQRCLAGIRV